MAAATVSNRRLHIAMFPWLAFGHMIPFLELAKLIAQKGHKISFISTPRNIKRLPKIPENLSPLINLVSLTLPREGNHNLPEDAEATSDLPTHEIPYLKIAYDNLQDSLAEFLQNTKPDWIINDFAPYWLPPIAEKLGIRQAYFSIVQAFTVCFFGSSSSAMINGEDPRTEPQHFTVSPPWVPFASNKAFRIHEAKKLFDHFEVNDSGVTDMFRLGSIISACDVMAIRSCTGLESKWLDLLEQLHNKPVLPIGLLPPTMQDDRDNEEEDAWVTICEWLEKQKKQCVVYVALGSELNLSQGELTELAKGIELSGLPFFWSLRNKKNLVDLPDGFEERVKGRGLVWTGWAPQLKILSHDSIGACLTHCGFSSVTEALYFGRPLIMLPFSIDQGLIARVYVERKVGIEVMRSEEDGAFTGNSLAESIRLVVVEEEGRIYRDEAKEVSAMYTDKKLHYRYVDKFVEFLHNQLSSKKNSQLSFTHVM